MRIQELNNEEDLDSAINDNVIYSHPQGGLVYAKIISNYFNSVVNFNSAVRTPSPVPTPISYAYYKQFWISLDGIIKTRMIEVVYGTTASEAGLCSPITDWEVVNAGAYDVIFSQNCLVDYPYSLNLQEGLYRITYKFNYNTIEQGQKVLGTLIGNGENFTFNDSGSLECYLEAFDNYQLTLYEAGNINIIKILDNSIMLNKKIEKTLSTPKNISLLEYSPIPANNSYITNLTETSFSGKGEFILPLPKNKKYYIEIQGTTNVNINLYIDGVHSVYKNSNPFIFNDILFDSISILLENECTVNFKQFYYDTAYEFKNKPSGAESTALSTYFYKGPTLDGDNIGLLVGPATFNLILRARKAYSVKETILINLEELWLTNAEFRKALSLVRYWAISGIAEKYSN